MILAFIRTLASAVLAGLAAVDVQYHWAWLPGIIAAGSVLGIHAIPAIGQASPKEREET